jgi:hypothetical protein
VPRTGGEELAGNVVIIAGRIVVALASKLTHDDTFVCGI